MVAATAVAAEAVVPDAAAVAAAVESLSQRRLRLSATLVFISTPSEPSRPVYTDTITAQVTGVITAVHFREGQFVQKGDPLIDIDARPYAASWRRRRERWLATKAYWPRPRWI